MRSVADLECISDKIWKLGFNYTTYYIRVFKRRLIASRCDSSFRRYWLKDSHLKCHTMRRHFVLTWAINRWECKKLNLCPSCDPTKGVVTVARHLSVALSRCPRVWRHERTTNPNCWDGSVASFLDRITIEALCNWLREQFKANRVPPSSCRSRGAFFRLEVAAVSNRQVIWLQSTISPIEKPNDIVAVKCGKKNKSMANESGFENSNRIKRGLWFKYQIRSSGFP